MEIFFKIGGKIFSKMQNLKGINYDLWLLRTIFKNLSKRRKSDTGQTLSVHKSRLQLERKATVCKT